MLTQTENSKRATAQAISLRLSVVVVSLRSVILTGLHAAFLEIYFRNRMGTDRSAQLLKELLITVYNAETRASR